jgi:hypothetical protein
MNEGTRSGKSTIRLLGISAERPTNGLYLYLYLRRNLWYSFLEAESTPRHMVPSGDKEQIPSDNTRNRSRDFPTGSTMPYPLRHPRPEILLMLLKILDNDKNYHDNWSVSSALLNASLSSRCGLRSSFDGGDGHQIWRVVDNILNKQ